MQIRLSHLLNLYQTDWSCAGEELGLSTDGVSVGRVRFALP